MSENERSPESASETITPGERRWVLLWAAGLLAVYAIAGAFGVRQLQRYGAEAVASRLASLASVVGASTRSGGAGAISSGAPTLVAARIDILHVGDIAIRESAWSAEFVIRLQWMGDHVNPGESFRIANGQITQRELLEAGSAAGERYAAYRVSARLVRAFDPSRFPFADEWLTLEIEDGAHSARTLRYVVDEHAGDVDPEAVPRSLKLERHDLRAILHPGESGPIAGGAAGDRVRSRLVFGMLVAPVSRSLYMSMFQALFASIAIAMIVFFIKPIHVDPRFGLSIGAFFAAVSNNVYVGSILPEAGRLTLASMVNAVGLGTIFLTLVQSTISLYVLDSLGRARLSRFFDRVSFAVMLIGCVGVNLALPLAAGS